VVYLQPVTTEEMEQAHVMRNRRQPQQQQQQHQQQQQQQQHYGNSSSTTVHYSCIVQTIMSLYRDAVSV